MNYLYTPKEAQGIADTVAKWLKRHKYSIEYEAPLRDEIEYCTTLLGKKNQLSILVEVQKKPYWDKGLNQLALEVCGAGLNLEFFVATERDADFSGVFFKNLDRCQVGLLIVEEDETVTIEREPRNPALMVRANPDLSFGRKKREVVGCLAKFNAPNSSLSGENPRKDALRDMCELLELLTEEIAVKAVRKGYLKCTEDEITDKDWNGQIDKLGSQKTYVAGKTRVLDSSLRSDLHSFRGGRNLLNHKVRSKREEQRRQRQALYRMLMGMRLVTELVAIHSRLK